MNEIFLKDKVEIKDRFGRNESKRLADRAAGIRMTDITIRKTINNELGEVVFRGSNKVILAGSTFTALKHFNIDQSKIIMTPSYNTVLALENSVTESHDPNLEKVFLFAMGTDGSDSGFVLNEVKYAGWLKPENMVPFRYPNKTSDISSGLRSKYFGRKVGSDKIFYYFKAFENEPVLHQQFIDGTPIDANIYNSKSSTEVETYIELNLKILKEDAREYFKATTGIQNAKVNTIQLLTGWKKTIGDFGYYQDIRPLTKLNFPTEFLIDDTKGLDITYHLFY